MVAVFLSLLMLCQEPAAEPAPKADGEAPSWLKKLRGSVSARYRSRWTGEDRDADLYQFLTLSYGDPETDTISGSASARFAEDLDGEGDVSGFYVFDSSDDSYHHSSTGRLYTAYVDVNRVIDGVFLRGGRQILEEFPEAVPLDGGKLRVEAWEVVEVGAFGGRPVNLFESSPDGDAMYGGWLGVDPWARARARLEYLHLEDENTFGAFDDDLIGISLEQRAGAFILHARHTWLEEDNRETTVRIGGALPDAGFFVNLRGAYVHERQQALSYAIDPYSLFLLDLEPYVQLALQAGQSVGEHLVVDGSVTMRELAEDSDEREYNREFVRANLTPSLADWPIRGVTVSLAGDYWESSGDDFWTAGGDVTCRLHRDVTVGADTGYALYSIDAFTGEERERVRSVSVFFRWRLPAKMRLQARLIYEKDDFDTYGTFEVGVRHGF